MIARFYIGLVSVSFVATAWGMGHHHEDLHNIKHSKPMLAPVHIQRNFGIPYSHSAPADLSHVPTPKSLVKKRDSQSPRHSDPALSPTEIAIAKKQADAQKVKEEQLKKAAALREVFEQAKVTVSIGDTTIEGTFVPNQPKKSEQKA